MSNDSVPKEQEKQNAGEWRAKFERAEKTLREREEKRTYLKKRTIGDASETGLIKFTQPLLMGEL